MLCEKCRQHPASVSYHQIIDGEEKWLCLCDGCAESFDLSHPFTEEFSDFSDPKQNLFRSQLSGRVADEPTKKRCPFCESHFDEITKTGRLGCEHCYDVFLAELRPTLDHLHGAGTVHKGKVPRRHAKSDPSDRLAQLKERLQQAIESQAFEEAARLRDLIRLLEQASKGGEEA